MTVDYAHLLSFDPIMYGRKQSNSTPSLVYGIKMPGLSCWYGAYGSDHPVCTQQILLFSIIFHNMVS